MSRLVALSIVLCLTAGQDVAAICQAWCGVQETATSACSHPKQPTRQVQPVQDHCSDAVPSAPVLIRDDVRRPVVTIGQAQMTPGSSADGPIVSGRGRSILRPPPGSGPPAPPIPLRI